MYSLKIVYINIDQCLVRLFILAKVIGTFKTDQMEREMLQILFTYEKVPGQVQRFLAQMSKNFSGPIRCWNILGGAPSIASLRLVQYYGQKYDDDKLNSILKTMPGAVQIPVDQTKLPRSPPARMENTFIYYFNGPNDWYI
ncbi:hypothetical protein C1646_772560 [Rhizophagus diaphanus]|nr:hypothetical protein C1646_772560 [Rhizophagus diaphanus] [Rhizophagus sp. MUCL 43196]